jgi:hypothetical protein
MNNKTGFCAVIFMEELKRNTECFCQDNLSYC